MIEKTKNMGEEAVVAILSLVKKVDDIQKNQEELRASFRDMLYRIQSIEKEQKSMAKKIDELSKRLQGSEDLFIRNLIDVKEEFSKLQEKGNGQQSDRKGRRKRT